MDNPPLKLVLFENTAARERINHLGVEVFEAEELEKASRRLEAAGMIDLVEKDETCCHSTQDKVWTQEPQGLRWEWYRVKDDNPAEKTATPHPCCTTTGCA